MGNQIRAVFLDIDGTLVHQGRLVPSAEKAVRLLRQNDIYVALCTGRAQLHTRQIQHRLELPDAVYFNGGLTVQGEDVVKSNPLSPEVVQRIRDFSFANELPAIFHSRKDALVFTDIPSQLSSLLEEYQFPALNHVSSELWQAQTEDVYQANVFMAKTWDVPVQNHLPECLLYRWDDTAVDLQRRGCDKSVGALALLERLGISTSEAVHIGDGGNDVGMFQNMGMSVAMGNAPREVQHQAQMLTDRVQDDGVYHALKRLKLI
ncbi:MAG: hypothetical protein A2201_00230 [Alicyclobacillus sp. RIFOXYA1_FULL_53_8]|nr:MAG: hypothetical protein A2201_00230 [Alicyclobacillus sp. RIFOXYA1_FULL_53_8]